MSLMSFILTIVTSGLVSALISGAFGLRKDRLTRRDDRCAAARDALKSLEDVYVDVAGGGDDGTVQPAESAFLAEVDKCAHDPLSAAAQELVGLGRLYAAGDEDVGVARFEESVDAVRVVLRDRMRRLT